MVKQLSAAVRRTGGPFGRQGGSVKGGFRIFSGAALEGFTGDVRLGQFHMLFIFCIIILQLLQSTPLLINIGIIFLDSHLPPLQLITAPHLGIFWSTAFVTVIGAGTILFIFMSNWLTSSHTLIHDDSFIALFLI